MTGEAKAARRKAPGLRAIGGRAVLVCCASLLLCAGGGLAAQDDAGHLRVIRQEAQTAMSAGDYAGAIAKYEEALGNSPHDAGAEIGLGQAYRAIHNYDEAKEILERAVGEHPKNEAALAILGNLEIQLQIYAPAVQHLAAALALKPDDEPTRIWLAVAYKSTADFPNALAQLEKVLASDPNNALAYYERAQVYSNQDRDGDALRDAEKAVELKPNPPARLELAKILLRLPVHADAAENAKRCSRAVEFLEPLAEAQPKSVAPADFSASGSESSDSETLFFLSRAYRCAGQIEQAQTVLAQYEVASKNERTAKGNQMEAKHLVQQANDAAVKNDFRGSLDLLQQAIDKDPSFGAAYSQLAKLYYSAGDVDKASEAIGKALSLDPYQPDFLYVQGKVLEKQGRFDEALAAFERTTLVNPRESDAYFEMGEVYAQRKDLVRARAAFKKAVELSPDDADYRRALESVK
jgi:tetratricopeptide (TPR) repeat protein